MFSAKTKSHEFRLNITCVSYDKRNGADLGGQVNNQFKKKSIQYLLSVVVLISQQCVRARLHQASVSM